VIDRLAGLEEKLAREGKAHLRARETPPTIDVTPNKTGG